MARGIFYCGMLVSLVCRSLPTLLGRRTSHRPAARSACLASYLMPHFDRNAAAWRVLDKGIEQFTHIVVDEIGARRIDYQRRAVGNLLQVVLERHLAEKRKRVFITV
jgi:hypothetical protein